MEDNQALEPGSQKSLFPYRPGKWQLISICEDRDADHDGDDDKNDGGADGEDVGCADDDETGDDVHDYL